MTPADRQSQQEESAASEEQRRVAERDQPFWEDIVKAALTGNLDSRADMRESIVRHAVALADLALQARNTRWPDTRHPTREDDSDE